MSKKTTRNLPSPMPRLFDAYDVVYQTRNLEINLFWQRSNYFLVLNTAIVTAIALLMGSPGPLAGIFIAFGIFVSYLSYRVNLGSKFWQSRWEQKLQDIEREIPLETKVFSATFDEIEGDVRKSLAWRGEQGLWHRFMTKGVLSKPSVSQNMIVLSLGFLVLDLIFLAVWLVRMLLGKAA
jgi:hypothetical protein